MLKVSNVRKRKIEQMVTDMKEIGGKKKKSSGSPSARKTKMTSNKETEENTGSVTVMDTKGEQCLRTLMLDMSSSINKSISGLNERIDQLEDNLEKKLVDKPSNVINAPIKDEIAIVRADFDSEICAMRTKILDMEQVIKDFDSTGVSGNSNGEQIPCSVIVRNLKEGQNETTGSNSIAKNKVTSLVRDGLKLKDVKVTNAERKQSKGDNPGLVVASFESFEQLNKVLENKKHLQKNSDYRSVYIEKCLSKNEICTQATFRTLVKEIGKNDSWSKLNDENFIFRENVVLLNDCDILGSVKPFYLLNRC